MAWSVKDLKNVYRTVLTSPTNIKSIFSKKGMANAGPTLLMQSKGEELESHMHGIEIEGSQLTPHQHER